MDKLREYTIGGKIKVIKKIWSESAAAYGSSWKNKYGEGVQENERTGNEELTKVGTSWVARLGKFTERSIDQAIESCQETYSDRAPNLFQFAKLCKKNSPKEKNPYQDSHLCEHTDERGFRCANPGTLSANIREGGPWLCAQHYGGGSEIQKRRGVRERLVEQKHAEFKQEHPELWPQPDDKPGDVARRNLKFINEMLGGRSVGQELPYDKNVSLSGDDSGMTREESIAKADIEPDRW